jgi:hypothetical protein
MNKFNTKKVVVSGLAFDSKKEARRYQELYFMERSGEITDLQCQVKFVLIPAQYETYERYGKKGQRLKDGKRCIEKECSYVADFTYKKNGTLVVEDTKGYRNPSTAGYAYFVLKRKLMLWVHGIRISEI